MKVKDFLKLLDEDEPLTINFSSPYYRTFFAGIVKDFGKTNKSKRTLNMKVVAVYTDDCIDGICIDVEEE